MKVWIGRTSVSTIQSCRIDIIFLLIGMSNSCEFLIFDVYCFLCCFVALFKGYRMVFYRLKSAITVCIDALVIDFDFHFFSWWCTQILQSFCSIFHADFNEINGFYQKFTKFEKIIDKSILVIKMLIKVLHWSSFS